MVATGRGKGHCPPLKNIKARYVSITTFWLTKIVATRHALWAENIPSCVCDLGELTVYSAPTNPAGKEGRGGEKRAERKGEEREGRDEKNGMEWILPPCKKFYGRPC